MNIHLSNATLCVLAMMLAMIGCRAPQTQSTVQSQPALNNANSSVNLIRPASYNVSLASLKTTQSDDPSQIGDVVLASLNSTTSDAFPLTLDDAISLGLQRNPDLTAVRASEPVARAALRVAEVYPYNPQFQTQVMPYSRDTNGEDGSVSQQHVVVQTFEWGGQQWHREGAARATLQQVNGTVQSAELLNMSQTSRLFFTAAYQRELRDLNEKLAELNERLIGVMERREKAGQANQADVALSRLQAQSSRRQQRLIEANFQTAILALQSQLNFDRNMPVELAGNWVDTHWMSLDESAGLIAPTKISADPAVETASLFGLLDEESLRQLVAGRPDVAAARSAVAVAHENLQLAQAMRRPNLQAGPMYQRDNSATQFWGVQAQIDLPVVNTGRPLVQQRCAELRLQKITAEQLENRAVREAQAAISRYERARRLVEQSRSEVSADLMESLKPFDDQFKAGQITVLQVYAARTTLVQSRQSFLDLLNELSLAAADVTQATGLPPQRMMTQ